MTYLTEDIDVFNEQLLEALEENHAEYCEKGDFVRAKRIEQHVWDLGKFADSITLQKRRVVAEKNPRRAGFFEKPAEVEDGWEATNETGVW